MGSILLVCAVGTALFAGLAIYGFSVAKADELAAGDTVWIRYDTH